MDTYSCVAATEDRARIMEFFMTHDDEAELLIQSPLHPRQAPDHVRRGAPLFRHRRLGHAPLGAAPVTAKRAPVRVLSQRVDKPHPCHSEERSDVGIRIFLDRNLRKTQNLCVLETDCHTSVRTGSQ